MKYLLALVLLYVAMGLVPRNPAPQFEALAVLPNHTF